MKEEARNQGGAHLLVTGDKRTMSAMNDAHKEYKKRINDESKKKREEEERINAEEERKKMEEQKMQEAKS